MWIKIYNTMLNLDKIAQIRYVESPDGKLKVLELFEDVKKTFPIIRLEGEEAERVWNEVNRLIYKSHHRTLSEEG